MVLIPEVAFRLTGDGGLLHHVQRRVQDRGYAVVAVAEGAGQELLDGIEAPCDASGNTGLRDVGALLRRRFAEYFAAAGIEACIRFIDPSYAIRSVPA
ncbi:MAG: ATP-dependent 6-phosphofructokinase, partial [Pseudonocardiaceae bacterium]